MHICRLTLFFAHTTFSGKGKGGRGEKKSTTASAKAGLQFPVGRIGRYLRQGGKVRQASNGRAMETVLFGRATCSQFGFRFH